MRPITKIFLLLLTVFLACLLWPRDPDMDGFAPAELAALRVQSWKAENNGKSLGTLFAVYQVYANQYHFPPVTSLRIAQSEASAAKTIRTSGGDLDLADGALPALQEKYALIRTGAQIDIDADSCARGELGWRTLELEGKSSEVVAKSMSDLMKMIYGGEASTYVDAARNLAGSRAILRGAPLPEGYADPKQAAMELAIEGYNLLKEQIGKQAAVAN